MSALAAWGFVFEKELNGMENDFYSVLWKKFNLI